MANPEPTRPAAPRFSRNNLALAGGLVLLFIGVALVYSPGMACLVVGAVVLAITLLSAYFEYYLLWKSLNQKAK